MPPLAPPLRTLMRKPMSNASGEKSFSLGLLNGMKTTSELSLIEIV